MADTIAITGPSGLVGSKLFTRLKKEGYQIILVTRYPVHTKRKLPGAIKYIQWGGGFAPDLTTELDGVKGIIHLAGAGVAAERWSEFYKDMIFQSRVASTKALVDSMKLMEQRPEFFISASAVGYYGDTGERLINEQVPAGKTFLAGVCEKWEQEALEADKLGVRTTVLRTGVVLSPDGGALERMIPPFKYYIGGTLGSGKQWFSWLHIDDILGIIRYAMDAPAVSGAYNATAPNPVRMKDLAKALGKALGRPAWFPVPEFVLRLVLGESATEVTRSLRVMPERLMSSGFVFAHPEIEEALRNLLQKQ